ncbi:hypothetical protein QJQ45_026021 [Haematococcus lacustris]|nr:hypothetical protein QJQ45_026021 [Haematococcus lacustris]
MAEPIKPEDTAATFPLPPDFYKLYGPSQQGPPPPLPPQGPFQVFDRQFDLVNIKAQLLSLNAELLPLFLEVLRSLGSRSAVQAAQLSRLMLVLNAMQHLTNMLRPHQALATLEYALKVEVQEREEALAQVRAQVYALDKLLMQSGDSLAATAGPEEGTIMLELEPGPAPAAPAGQLVMQDVHDTMACPESGETQANAVASGSNPVVCDPRRQRTGPYLRCYPPAEMALMIENPRPLLTRSRPSSADRQLAWEQLALEHDEEDVFLRELAGVDRLEEATSLQAVIDTSVSTVSHLGSKLPSLLELNLNGSVLQSIRDLGTGFTQLHVLWVSRCGLTGLEGIGALPSLRELYASFNDISDLQPLDGSLQLEVLDLEGNCVAELDMCLYLSGCTMLQSLVLTGNPVTSLPDYRQAVRTALPSLSILDDQATTTDSSGGTPQPPLTALGRTSLDSAAAGAAGTEPPAAGAHAGSSTPSLAAGELALVSSGIKHARVGLDSREFREAEMLSLLGGSIQLPADPTSTWAQEPPASPPSHRPASSLPTSAGWGLVSNTGTAASTQLSGQMPGTGCSLMPPNAGGWLRTLRASQAGGSLAAFWATRSDQDPSSTPLLPRSGSTGPASGGSPGSSRPASSARAGQATPGDPSEPECSSWGSSVGHGGPGSAPGSSSTHLASVNGWVGLQAQSSSRAGEGASSSSDCRPGTDLSTSLPSRPRSAASNSQRPHSARPATALALALLAPSTGLASSLAGSGGSPGGNRVGTGASAPPTAGGLYWRKHRLQATRGPAAGPAPADSVLHRVAGLGPPTPAALLDCADSDMDADTGLSSSSALTYGGDAIAGNLTKDLRKRRKAGAAAAAATVSSPSTTRAQIPGSTPSRSATPAQGLGCDPLQGSGSPGKQRRCASYDGAALLQELMRWKLDAADRAMLPEDVGHGWQPRGWEGEGQRQGGQSSAAAAASEGPVIAAAWPASGPADVLLLPPSHAPNPLPQEVQHAAACLAPAAADLRGGACGSWPAVPHMPVAAADTRGAAPWGRGKTVLAKVVRDAASSMAAAGPPGVVQGQAGGRAPPTLTPANLTNGSSRGPPSPLHRPPSWRQPGAGGLTPEPLSPSTRSSSRLAGQPQAPCFLSPQRAAQPSTAPPSPGLANGRRDSSLQASLVSGHSSGQANGGSSSSRGHLPWATPDWALGEVDLASVNPRPLVSLRRTSSSLDMGAISAARNVTQSLLEGTKGTNLAILPEFGPSGLPSTT